MAHRIAIDQHGNELIIPVTDSSSGGGGVPAVAISKPDTVTGTIQARPVTINPNGSTSYVGEPVTAFYSFNAPGKALPFPAGIGAGRIGVLIGGLFIPMAGAVDTMKLLLHLDGDVTDSSSDNRTDITWTGITWGTGKFGQAAHFPGNGSQEIFIPASPFLFGGDFTIQFWANAADTLRRGVFANQSDCVLAIDTNRGTWNIAASGTPGQWDILVMDPEPDDDPYSNSGSGTIAVTPGTPQHIAFVHSGSDWFLFVDGRLSVHKIRSGNIHNNGLPFRIGRYGSDYVTPWSGCIDEFRIDTAALWTEEFTPPEQPF